MFRRLRCLRRAINKRHVYRNYENNNFSSKYEVYPSLRNENQSANEDSSRNIYGEFDQSEYEVPSLKKKNLKRALYFEKLHNELRKSMKEESEKVDDEPSSENLVHFHFHGLHSYYTKESCYIFKSNNKLRRLSAWITEWPHFNKIILLMILIQAIALGFYDFASGLSSSSDFGVIFLLTHKVFSGFYLLEICMKIITRGFYYDLNSYLRTPINVIDFFVAFTIVYSYFDTKLDYFYILRLYRIIYYIKDFSKFKSLNDLFHVFLKSVPHIFIVIFFLLFFMIIFAVFGINLWSGRLNFRCRLTPSPLNGSWPLAPNITRVCGTGFTCPEGTFCGSDFRYKETNDSFIIGDPYKDVDVRELNWGLTNFDNFLLSLRTVFQIYTVEGWNEIIYIVSDSIGALIPMFYSILLIILCSYFIGNMIVAAMVDNFTKLQSHDHKKTLNFPQQNSNSNTLKNINRKTFWGKIKEYLNKKAKNNNPHDKLLRKLAFNFVNHPAFEVVVYISLFCNIVILCLNGYPLPFGPGSDKSIRTANTYFSVFFFLEIILKLFSKTSSIYESDKFPFFELVVAVGSLGEIILGYEHSYLSSLRVLKFLRIINKDNSWDSLKILVTALSTSFYPALSFVFFMSVHLYVFSIIGMKYFAGKFKFNENGDVDLINGVSPRANFDNLLWAYTTVVQITIGEKWHEVLYLAERTQGKISFLYFIFVIFTGQRLFMNLFLAFLLGIFEQTRKKVLRNKLRVEMILSKLTQNKVMPDTRALPESGYEDRRFKNERNNTVSRFRSNIKVSPEAEIIEIQPKKEISEEKRKTELSTNIDTNEALKTTEGNNKDEKNAPNIETLNTEENLLGSYTSINPNLLDPEKVSTERRRSSIRLPVKEKLKNMRASTMVLKQKSDKNEQNPDEMLKDFQNLKLNERKPREFNPFDMTFIRSTTSSSFFFQPTRSRDFFTDLMGSSSLFIFSDNSFIRRKITYLISTKVWDSIILMCILLSSLILAIDGPMSDRNRLQSQVFNYADVFFTFFFTLEMTLKIISMGFLFNHDFPENAYLRSAWNILDGFVVMVSLMDFLFGSESGLKSLKSLRALRALRPLKVITKNESLKIIVNALFRTLPSLLNLVVVAIVVSLVVSINAMQLWMGKFYYCSIDKKLLPKINTRKDCEQSEGLWVNQANNFDNILRSSLSFFLIMSNEDWLGLMYSSIDAVGIDLQPRKNHNTNYVFFYYFMLLSGNILIMNMFVGVVIDNFKQMKEELCGYSLLNEEQREWVDIQRFMQRKQLKIKIDPPKNKTRAFCYYISNQPVFEIFIFVCIMLNIISMSVDYEGISADLLSALSIASNIFLAIYHFEFIIKFVGCGLFYFKDTWNKFDFGVIVSTDVILILFLLYNNDVISSIPLLMRSLRMGKIIKYIKISKTVKVLVDTYYYFMPSLLNNGFLISLIVSIYAIMGFNLFATIKFVPYDEGSNPADMPNFSTLGGSFLVLLQSITGQRWNYYMMQYAATADDCKDDQTYEEFVSQGPRGCGTILAYPYFISFIVICPMMMMNIFIAVVLEGYLESLKENEALIPPHKMDEFLEKWAEYDPEGLGFISPENLAFLLHELHPPVGLKDDNIRFEYDLTSRKNKGFIISPNRKVILSKLQIFSTIRQFNIPIYVNQQLHFKDVCIQISHNAVCKKWKIPRLSIGSEYVMRTVIRGWFSVFPNLRKHKTINSGQSQPTLAAEYLARLRIGNFLKKLVDLKKYRENTKPKNIKMLKTLTGDTDNEMLLKQKNTLKPHVTRFQGRKGSRLMTNISNNRNSNILKLSEEPNSAFPFSRNIRMSTRANSLNLNLSIPTLGPNKLAGERSPKKKLTSSVIKESHRSEENEKVNQERAFWLSDTDDSMDNYSRNKNPSSKMKILSQKKAKKRNNSDFPVKVQQHYENFNMAMIQSKAELKLPLSNNGLSFLANGKKDSLTTKNKSESNTIENFPDDIFRLPLKQVGELTSDMGGSDSDMDSFDDKKD